MSGWHRVGALLVGAALGACGTAGAGREVPVTMVNFGFLPESAEVSGGERVAFLLANPTDLDHEFESDAASFEEVIVPSGKTRRIAWTAPQRAGDYEFVCDMAGHEGMRMTIRVR